MDHLPPFAMPPPADKALESAAYYLFVNKCYSLAAIGPLVSSKEFSAPTQRVFDFSDANL